MMPAIRPTYDLMGLAEDEPGEIQQLRQLRDQTVKQYAVASVFSTLFVAGMTGGAFRLAGAPRALRPALFVGGSWAIVSALSTFAVAARFDREIAALRRAAY